MNFLLGLFILFQIYSIFFRQIAGLQVTFDFQIYDDIELFCSSGSHTWQMVK